MDFVEQCVLVYLAVLVEQLLFPGTSWGVSLKGIGSKRFHALCPCCLPKGIRILPLLPVRPHHANRRSSFSSRSCNPSQYFRSSFSVCGSGNTEHRPDNIQRCQGSLSLQESRVGERFACGTTPPHSGNSPAAAAGRWAVCGEQAAPCRRQVPCRNRSSTFPQPCREKVEKVCRQNRSHRHLPDRRNSGNGCPPSCWGVYPRERDSTSYRSGLRRSRIAPLPAGSRWRSLRPKRQRGYPPSQWVGYRRKDETR